MSRAAVTEHRGSAGELHALAMPTEGGAQIWRLVPIRRAVVMGSAQRPDAFVGVFASDGRGPDPGTGPGPADADDLPELVGRRSGGGAVYIDPPGVVWVDVVAPFGSALATSDLTTTFLEVGRVWQQALSVHGIATELIERSDAASPVSRAACWAGLGWGELTAAGHKVVGLSQRRTRWGVRVQGMAVLNGSAPRVADHLADVALATAVRSAFRQLGTPPPVWQLDPADVAATVVDALVAAC